VCGNPFEKFASLYQNPIAELPKKVTVPENLVQFSNLPRRKVVAKATKELASLAGGADELSAS